MSVCEEFQTPPGAETDARWMRAAIDAARAAAREHDEVPVGACVVSDVGELLAVAGNRTRGHCL